jgi:spermidine synthase
MELTVKPTRDRSDFSSLSASWQPVLTALVAGACMMVLEIVAGRIAAPYIGYSLYTWTMIIGVVLAGTSLGNYLGGRLADRWASPRLLGGILALGGLASLCILAIDVLKRLTTVQSLTLSNLPLIVGLVVFASLLFFVPCTILGAVSPTVARLAVRDLGTTGSALGRIYAAGSLGSILGTFAAGFVLISSLGTHAVVWGVGWLLVVLGLLFLLGRRWLWVLPVTLAVALGTVLVFGQGWLRGPCVRETDYFCIQVRQEEYQGRRVLALYLDRLLHSYSSPDDPTQLVYEYEKLYADTTAYQAQRKGGQLRTLFIGGGGYTFPRYVAAAYPGSAIHVVEIDPGVTEVAYQMLGLRRDSGIVTYNEDARMFLARQPSGRYDLILGDAFNDFSVPYHLTTREFNDRVHAWLAEDGLYVVNIIDGPWGQFLRAYAHTLRQTFQHVYLAFTIQSWRQSPRSTLVLIAGDVPLDMGALQEAGPLLASQLLSDAEVEALLTEGRVVTLTDRYAPVDQMLMRVFLDQVPR